MHYVYKADPIDKAFECTKILPYEITAVMF